MIERATVIFDCEYNIFMEVSGGHTEQLRLFPASTVTW